VNRPVKTICMLSNLAPPVVSGSSTQTFALSRELVARGYRVLIVTAHVVPGTPAVETVDGVEFHRLPAWRLPRMSIALDFPWLGLTYRPSNLAHLERLLREREVDLLHLHNHMFDLGFAAARMRERLGLPLVLTFHTIIQHANPFFDAILRPADRLLLRRAVVRHADAIVCPDRNVDAYVRRRFGREDGQLVPYGLTPPREAAPEEVESLRRRYGLERRPVVLSVGHVHGLRHRLDLVAGFAKVLRQQPDARLVIVGEVGDDRAQRLSRELGIEHAVIFTGPQPHESIPAFLALAEIEAHWFHQEGTGNTSLGVASMEAMYAGKAVLAAAGADTFAPGVIRDGRNLFTVPKDAPDRVAEILLKLLREPERCRAVGRAARETMEQNFSWQRIGDDTLEVYRGALTRRAQTANAGLAAVA
jgi:glycosyltransferase involved in cell wall biosynthesis